MFKKIAVFALFLAVTALFAATSVNAQRLIKVTKSDPTDTLLDPVPEANPDFSPTQCANGGIGKPAESCGASGSTNWDTGNMNGSKAHYPEGSNVHYRYVFSNLTPGTTYKIRIAYDSWEGTRVAGSTAHTLDYLNTYDTGVDGAATVGYTVNPCGGVSGCAGPTTFPIPADPAIPGGFVPPAGRVFTAWGINTLANVNAALRPSTFFEVPSNPNAGERVIEITFTPTVSNPVIAWSGHVAKTPEWNAKITGDTGAGGQTGSPYHMRNAGNGTFNGQRELQLAATAVQIGPSAADATVTGRVTDAYGRAIASAKLSLTNAITGEVETVYTNTFGYYRFDSVPVGDFFVMSVQHRRYLFVNGSVSFSLEDSIAGLNFQASR